MTPISKTEHIERKTAILLSNVASIVTSVVRDVSGNEISNSLNGESVTTEVIASIVNQRIRHNLIHDGCVF